MFIALKRIDKSLIVVLLITGALLFGSAFTARLSAANTVTNQMSQTQQSRQQANVTYTPSTGQSTPLTTTTIDDANSAITTVTSVTSESSTTGESSTTDQLTNAANAAANSTAVADHPAWVWLSIALLVVAMAYYAQQYRPSRRTP